ncbi:hypothetical protein ACP3WZ_26100, partial [Salmonella enterica]|uniref:hypothetical protein n=1 Tax=Salmonella enterica TaxID=28901 RepID=UPI003CE88E14
ENLSVKLQGEMWRGLQALRRCGSVASAGLVRSLMRGHAAVTCMPWLIPTIYNLLSKTDGIKERQSRYVCLWI